MIKHRLALVLLSALPLTACQSTQERIPQRNNQVSAYQEISYDNWYAGSIPDARFDIPTIDWGRVPREFHRQRVLFNGRETAGSIVIDTANKYLYLVEGGGTAIRYGIGVGKQGFEFKGAARVGRKAEWPSWSPTPNMVRLNPRLPPHLPGGLNNPLGARALYLYQGNQDTLFRIHGTNEPWSIGQAVSSGCIRMMNEDVYDLYKRVPVNAQVVVRS